MRDTCMDRKDTTMCRSAALVWTGALVLGVYVCSVLASGGDVGKGECKPRESTVQNRCAVTSTGCAGMCYKLEYAGCNDCVEGKSRCSPPSTSCQSRVGYAECVRTLGSCVCGGNWTYGPYKPASQGCG